MSVLVSAGLPTGMEGLTYPIPFSDPSTLLRIAQHAEKLGYHSVWGNDHMSTQNYVRAEFPQPPRFWEILTTYAWLAAQTKTLRFGTGILVLPMRRSRETSRSLLAMPRSRANVQPALPPHTILPIQKQRSALPE